MRTLLPNTALLIFTRSASLEARYKPLAFGRKSARQVAQLLNNKAITLAKSTGLSYFIIDESLQEGTDFAKRLDAAFAHVFDKGFERVISIGNDCLELTEEQIIGAAFDLQQNDFVLGPTQLGGLYLLGLNQAAYQRLDFQTLPWQTDRLFTELSAQLHNSSYTLATLPLAWEINQIFEWRLAFKRIKRWVFLLKRLVNLLIPSPSVNFNYLAPTIFSYLFQIQQRGPPRI